MCFSYWIDEKTNIGEIFKRARCDFVRWKPHRTWYEILEATFERRGKFWLLFVHVKNKDIFKYNSDEFDEYYNRNLFHKFLITKKKID